MKHIRQILIGTACLISVAASAQWQWVDKAGRPVFSDRAPPQDIPEKSILKRPAGSTPANGVPDSDAAVAPPAAAASSPRLNGVDKELLAKKKKEEAAQVEKRKAQEEAVLKAKVENCARAKQAQATLNSKMRLSQVNDLGKTVVLDAATRAAEVKRIQAIIDSDCQ